MITTAPSTLRFASALTRQGDAQAAADDLIKAIREQMGPSRIDVAFLFISAQHADQAEALSEALRTALGPMTLVGCTGEGIIATGREIESGPAATLWAAHLPGVLVQPLRLSFSSVHDQFSLRNWPDMDEAGDNAPVMMLFADPFSTPMQEVLAVIEEQYPGTRTLGGLAGGGQDLGENRLFLDDQVYTDGLVGVTLSGNIAVRSVISQGCRPIGDRFIVTKAEHNVIQELGGMPALHCLQTVFEQLSSDERAQAQRALHIGIAMDEQRAQFTRGDFLIRNLLGADQQTGAIVIGDVIQEGQTVQFQVRDAHSADEDLHALLAAPPRGVPSTPLGALLFSCCGRGKGLFGIPHHDASVLGEQLGAIPLAGFFAQGEVGPVGGRNFLHGYTASIAIFSEPERRRQTGLNR
ncbi:MAG TPA: FIST N-terminal domain-containing protein [Nitrospira sp.]|nr:FIST N-terminal domain-containing protein [Nitrospira sp.]HPV81587.1 FIST N-terminal domain-containing protein [Nitrospira sp.]